MSTLYALLLWLSALTSTGDDTCAQKKADEKARQRTCASGEESDSIYNGF